MCRFLEQYDNIWATTTAATKKKKLFTIQAADRTCCIRIRLEQCCNDQDSASDSREISPLLSGAILACKISQSIDSVLFTTYAKLNTKLFLCLATQTHTHTHRLCCFVFFLFSNGQGIASLISFLYIDNNKTTTKQNSTYTYSSIIFVCL